MPRVLLLSNARSGSTYLSELLSSHPECTITRELLNNEEEMGKNDVFSHIENVLSKFPQTYAGFKAFPEQIFERNLRFDELIQKTGTTFIIVLWRENFLENFVSLAIAQATGVWYSSGTSSPPQTSLPSLNLDPEKIQESFQKYVTDWRKISDQWPKTNVQTILVRFEDLIQDPDKWTRFIFTRLACLVPPEFHFSSAAKRQNPSPLSKKISNWEILPENLKSLKFDASEILSQKINSCGLIPPEIAHLAPDREPPMPLKGWRYRVADPFLPTLAKQNVLDAISSGSISSAGFWPRLMSTKLKDLFQVPVAQPCSNGFTALVLALQAVQVGKDDEVILPSLTMVAVSNSVAILGARPIFVDCAPNNYNPSWEEIQSALTPKTKAVILTHTYGVPNPDLEKIAEECKTRGLWLLEDISECVGVVGSLNSDGSSKLLGTFGDFACASMYVNKMVHAGDGGFVIGRDPKFEPRLRSLVNHGFTPSYHFVHFEVALNGKMNGLGAAVACGCIEEIQTVMEHRKMISALYRDFLKDLNMLKLMPSCGPEDTPWVFGFECESKKVRTELRDFLAQSGIETRDYFFPLHLQPAYVSYRDRSNNGGVYLSISEKLGSTGFYLPTHSNLKREDLEFICSAVHAFFRGGGGEKLEVQPAPSQDDKISVQVINPDSFGVEVRGYHPSGELKNYTGYRGHVFLEAVKLSLEAEELLIREKWDSKNLFLSRAQLCIDEGLTQGLTTIQQFFTPYIRYFETQMSLEQPEVRPWLGIDLHSPELLPAQKIPTTTDPETLQTLVWLLHELRPQIIWEIGSWFGHATVLMAAAGKSLNFESMKIFACDAFRWQNWMGAHADMDKKMDGESFLEEYHRYIEVYKDVIEPVDWPYDIEVLPRVLIEEGKPNLIFLDITQDDEDLERVWTLIQPCLIPNETIILFNGLALTSIPFFTRHAEELVPVAKPMTIAKVFKYVPKIPKEFDLQEETTPKLFDRQVKFAPPPAWDHHHNNLFCETIKLLKDRLHSDDAEVLFVAAVEERMCDDPASFIQQPWIGIVHSVENYTELFYAPDLERLCARPNYHKLLGNCKGLFTLTQFQAQYLRKNLPSQFTFPIQPVNYPLFEIENPQPSLVPGLWKEGNSLINLALIGSFARDFQLFFGENVPANFQKVLLAGDSAVLELANETAPEDVQVLGRLSSEDYEALLRNSLIFLSLKYDGAANTLVLECIARNLPIVAPDLQSVVEYLGPNYPLLYSRENPNLCALITLENIQKAIEYLEIMDKSKFQPREFIKAVENGAVLSSLNPTARTLKTSRAPLDLWGPTSFPRYDVTISICSYRRTHHLKNILESLWDGQDFRGKIQIILWNNNDSRSSTVRDICRKYLENPSSRRSLELINSTRNHFCAIRFALPALMKSAALLICDDDVIPQENFISFFLSSSKKYPKDVLCLRGHQFSPHQLNLQDPTDVWVQYDHLKFHPDDAPETFIHFVHADACLIPKKALHEVASLELPDPSFALVDDYWMSFVLSHYFGRKLRKLSTSGSQPPIIRTDDSETAQLALHTRREVQDARIRMYIHHMLQNWPKWENPIIPEIHQIEEIQRRKRDFWEEKFVGYNISSWINEKGLEDLVKLGVSCVRIGAVGVGRELDFEFSGLLNEGDAGEEELQKIEDLVELLGRRNISVVLTLERRIVSPVIWMKIARSFAMNPFVVGYDLINEPFTSFEDNICLADVSSSEDLLGASQLENQYLELIRAIRSVDTSTPIIIEPSFWAHRAALEKLPLNNLLQADPSLIFSFHFYEPMLLTQRAQNQGRFAFPCEVPVYDIVADGSETIYWDEKKIKEEFTLAVNWAQGHKVKIMLGEFGISRDIKGAENYLRACFQACRELGLTGFLFSFRDEDWEAMDYELGPHTTNVFTKPCWESELMRVVIDGIRNCRAVAL